MNMLLTLIVSASLACIPAPSQSRMHQPERAAAPGVAAQKEAMKKIEWLAGDWEGTAKFDSGRGGGEDTWMTIRQSEAVKMKLSGRVMLIEGTGRVKAGEEDRVVFEALATVSYDPESQSFKMRAFGPEGAVDPSFEVGDKTVIWGFTTRMGKVKYTIKLDEKGRWVEVGERSGDDGKTWKKFIELTLERK